MLLFGLSNSIILSFLTIKSQSVYPAMFFHGVMLQVRPLPELISKSGYDPLIGPDPTGIVATSFLSLTALICLFLIYCQEKKHKHI